MNHSSQVSQLFKTNNKLSVDEFAKLSGMTVWEVNQLRGSGLGPQQRRTQAGEDFYLATEVKAWIARQSGPDNFGGDAA